MVWTGLWPNPCKGNNLRRLSHQVILLPKRIHLTFFYLIHLQEASKVQLRELVKKLIPESIGKAGEVCSILKAFKGIQEYSVCSRWLSKKTCYS